MSAAPTDDADIHLDYQLSFALYAASNRLARLYNAMLREFDLTFPQLLCLMALWETSPLLVGDFARKLELDNGSITPLLKRLEASGFVKRTRDPLDQRRVIVEILEAGANLKQPFRELRNRTAAAFSLDAALVNALRADLRKFSKVITVAPDIEDPVSSTDRFDMSNTNRSSST